MNQKTTILVVDDDMAHRTMLKALVSGWGYEIIEADDGSTAIEAVKERLFDLIIMDIRMVRISGIEALTQIKALNSAIPVIIMTAYSSVETAVKALREGAYDYLTKPLDFDKLKITIERAMEHIQLKVENRLLKESLGHYLNRQNIIGKSAGMKYLLETVARVAPSEASVIIYGESGTGKELIAGALHYNSHRNKGPFVKINCAAITETLLESELFGHEKGAFTGADRRKEGRFVQAHHGTLFLDEVSEMPLTMQAKLLRVLQEREVVRVGGEKVVSVDVRVLAATNKDLMEMIEKGVFREDLYYRLNVVNLHIPPLKDRADDIPLLAEHFLEIFKVRNNREIKGFSPSAMENLMHSEWPGNVRELMNTIERGVILARSEYLDIEDFQMTPKFIDEVVHAPISAENGVTEEILPLEEVERQSILKTLDFTQGNKSEAARKLGITRKTLLKKLKNYGVA
ncbi:sigma-54 dependent transcriptional regulator [Desulfobacterales bacterium HSG16]|nr:sigma-54 dependent transcriptional regulator [Desulfobacterales bacterium HSG16]